MHTSLMMVARLAVGTIGLGQIVLAAV